jgi:DivIVA domain-containing protein
MTPEEIENREFLVSLRGYDREEVHAFLSLVADEMRELQSGAGGGPAATERSGVGEQTAAAEPADELAGLESQLESAEAGGQAAESGRAGPDTGAAAGSESESVPAPRSEVAPTQEAGEAPDQRSAAYDELTSATRSILEAAQNAGDEIRANAQEEADRQIREARAKAETLIADGERRREALESVVRSLDETRSSVAAELRGAGNRLERLVNELEPPHADDAGEDQLPSASAEPSAPAADAGGAGGPAAASVPASGNTGESNPRALGGGEAAGGTQAATSSGGQRAGQTPSRSDHEPMQGPVNQCRY